MVALSLAHLGSGRTLAEPVPAVRPVQRAAFDEALRRNGVTGGEAVPGVAPTAPAPPAAPAAEAAPPVAEVSGAEGAARERARRTLDLDGSPVPREGDAILGGLQRLRGAFDGRHGRINDVMQSQATDMNTLLSLQLEIARYTILVDVSSKLTGKATQSMDTLMKG